MTFEKWLSEILDSRSINLSKMSKAIGISYGAIYNSLYSKGSRRELRSSELIAICKYLGVDPMEFEAGR